MKDGKKLESKLKIPNSAVKPLVVIVGETASGKSALALELAKRFNGEIIAADSRTVYKGMDIGTAKPSTQEQQEVKHHLLDVVNPDDRFSAADFKRLATTAINDIGSRGRLPVMVGGTGLYIDSVLFDFEFRPKADPILRQSLELLNVAELQKKIEQAGLSLPSNARNPRHLIRVLETDGAVSAHRPLRKHTLVLGLQIERVTLKERVRARINQMVQDGFVDEVRRLAEQYGWEAQAMQAPGYRAFRPYIEDKTTLEEVIEAFIKNDLNLAKRQRTWFKRNPDIHWIDSGQKAKKLVEDFLHTLKNL